MDFHGISCGETDHDRPHEHTTEADGGRDNDYEFRVYPPPSDQNPNPYLGGGDQIKITFTSTNFVLTNLDFDSDDNNAPPFDRIRT